jgi:hypothetical protein
MRVRFFPIHETTQHVDVHSASGNRFEQIKPDGDVSPGHVALSPDSKGKKLFAALPAAAGVSIASARRFVPARAARRGISSHTYFPLSHAPMEHRPLLQHRSSTHTQEEKDPCPI